MAVIIIILIIGAFVFFKLWNSPKEKYAREMSKGKNQEQIKTIRYFVGTLFGPKWKSDEEYENYINSISNIDVKNAIDHLGLDESEINEIEPTLIKGYIFNKNAFSKINNRNEWISSAYQATWILFGANQIFIYSKEFWADENRENVSTLEYFYRDVTVLRIIQESYEIIDRIIEINRIEEKTRQVNIDTLSIVVPGDKFTISINSSVGIGGKVKGMQQLLREKKNV